MIDRDELEKLPDFLKSFITYSQAVKEKSNLTVSEYLYDLRTFFRFLVQKFNMVPEVTEFDDIDISKLDSGFLKRITLYDAYEFIVYCKNERGNDASSRARKVSSIRALFKYLSNEVGVLDSDIMTQLSPPKLKRRLPKHLTIDECNALLNAIDGEFRERDFAIITLFLNCGMRLSELVGINMSDIKSDNTLTITGKGNKQRVIYLNNSCIEALKSYCAVRKTDGVKYDSRDALFISRNKRRISTQAVQLLVKKYLEKAGLASKNYTVHTLRHTAATLMYQYGDVDIVVLKEILGHENLNTTNIYTHIANQSVKDALERNPLNK